METTTPKAKVDINAIMEKARNKTKEVKTSTQKIGDKVNSFKLLPGFSKYEFNGNILRNVQTKHPLSPKTGRTKYQITDDSGKSHNLDKEEIKALFPVEAKKAPAKKESSPKAPKPAKVYKIKGEKKAKDDREIKYHHVPKPMALDKLKPDARKIMSFPETSYKQVIKLYEAGYSKEEIIAITGRRNDVISKYLRPLLKAKK